MIDDWDRLRRDDPAKTTAVIAYSRAEVKTLSYLMRQRILQHHDGPRYTIQSYRSREPRAKPEALELTVGDTLRIGPVRITPDIWQKHLFNGTHLEVLELRQDGRPARTRPASPVSGSGAAPTAAGSSNSTTTRSSTTTARSVSTTATP